MVGPRTQESSFAARLRRAIPRDGPGRVRLAAWHLVEAEPVLIEGSRPVAAASTIKVLVMITALRAVASGSLRLDRSVRLPAPDERAGGFGVLRELRGVRAMELGDLVTLMVVVSDNAATNTVIDVVGYDAIADTAGALGCEDTTVQRHLDDRAAMADGRDNRTSALDQARILAALAGREAMPADVTRQALGVLSRQQVRDRLPALLPDGAGCWNKTGEQEGVRHDVGLIGSAGRPEAVVAVLVDELYDARSRRVRGGPASDFIARCGAAVHDCLAR